MNAPEIKNGLLVLHGFNAGLNVWNRGLICKYGTFDETGELALSKAQTANQLRHIVILAGNGLLTTEALRWLDDAGISLSVIENDGHILLSQGRGNFPFATLARRQALAVYQNTGLEIAHWLMAEKLRGQAENLDRLGMGSERIRQEMAAIGESASVQELMLHEARAAGHYWGSLEGLPLTFIRKDQGRIPEHWLHLGGRISPISKRAMHAATPGQAVLNYTYAVAESLCSIELAAVGLHPEVGIVHTDVDSRRSMALDLIETVRPVADRLNFQYFQQQVFRKSDFWETERGSVRLGLEVRKAIVCNAFLLEGQVRDYAAGLRDRLSGYGGKGQRRRAVKMGDLELVPVCEYCGAALPGNRGTTVRCVCAGCLEIQRTENLSGGNAPGFKWSETALSKISKTQRAKNQDRLTWEAQFDEDELEAQTRRERQRFITEIYPRLSSITVTRLAKQVGVSPRYASLVKKGLAVPHPCLYPKFEECCNIENGRLASCENG